MNLGKRTPLPGSMMSREEEEKLAPAKTTGNASKNAGKAKPHYSDGADKDQTIPI